LLDCDDDVEPAEPFAATQRILEVIDAASEMVIGGMRAILDTKLIPGPPFHRE